MARKAAASDLAPLTCRDTLRAWLARRPGKSSAYARVHAWGPPPPVPPGRGPDPGRPCRGAGLSVHGIQKLERGATHPFRDTASRLERALQLEQEDLPVSWRRSGPFDATARFPQDLPTARLRAICRSPPRRSSRGRESLTRSLRACMRPACSPSRAPVDAARRALQWRLADAWSASMPTAYGWSTWRRWSILRWSLRRSPTPSNCSRRPGVRRWRC